MTDENEKNSFQYSYSAKEREEIKKIRDKYLSKEKEESSIERLRRLDGAVLSRATAFSLVFGILGTLILGLGMSVIMTEIADALGAAAMPLGIILGIIGAAVAAFAYPVFCFVLRRGREKAAPEILRLSEELMKQ